MMARSDGPESRYQPVELDPVMDWASSHGVPDRAAFRIDFPAWLRSFGKRRRAIATDLANGERTMNVADKFGGSRGRVSQMRREFAESWERFHEPEAERVAA